MGHEGNAGRGGLYIDRAGVSPPNHMTQLDTRLFALSWCWTQLLIGLCESQGQLWEWYCHCHWWIQLRLSSFGAYREVTWVTTGLDHFQCTNGTWLENSSSFLSVDHVIVQKLITPCLVPAVVTLDGQRPQGRCNDTTFFICVFRGFHNTHIQNKPRLIAKPFPGFYEFVLSPTSHCKRLCLNL
jgi:hypothetical protein